MRTDVTHLSVTHTLTETRPSMQRDLLQTRLRGRKRDVSLHRIKRLHAIRSNGSSLWNSSNKRAWFRSVDREIFIRGLEDRRCITNESIKWDRQTKSSFLFISVILKNRGTELIKSALVRGTRKFFGHDTRAKIFHKNPRDCHHLTLDI
jgi:hypothetical protein